MNGPQNTNQRFGPPELERAYTLHSQGNLAAAEQAFRQLTQTHPGLSDPWMLLGVIQMQRGKPAAAVAMFQEVIKRDFTNAMALGNMGGAYLQLHKYPEAEKALKKAVAIDPGMIDAQYNLGTLFNKNSRHQEALNQFEIVLRAAKPLSPDHVDALYNLGNTLLAAGNPEEAADRFKEAIAIDPAHAKASNNLSDALKHLGQFEQAVQTLQTAIEKSPGQDFLINSLINLLNYHMPDASSRGPHAQMQVNLQRLSLKDANASPISDETIQSIYRQSQKVVSSAMEGGPGLQWLQIWRGKAWDPGCNRHQTVFKECGIIPEYCFGCYKVSVDVANVVDLVKLMIIFDAIELPNDNTRKCYVEIRPEISGAYKGLIYCHDFDEAKALVGITNEALTEKIASPFSVSLKRGCSEFPLVFPEYGRVDDSEGPPMAYDEAWRTIEEKADRELVGHQYPFAFDSYNHPGLSLKDASILRAWMAYAAAICDESYLEITDTPMAALPIAKRPAFSPDMA